MFISRLLLNQKLRKVQIAQTNLEIFHAAIMKSIPLDNEDSRPLWRLDHLRGKLYLIIISNVTPNLSILQKQFGYRDWPGETKSLDSLLRVLEPGQKWLFKLTASPTMRKMEKNKFPDARRGRVTPIYNFPDQMIWLERVARSNGFTLIRDSIRTANPKRFFFRKGKNNLEVKFYSVSFEGVLVVEDSQLLAKALCTGIGREKAYGQGLLSLMR